MQGRNDRIITDLVEQLYRATQLESSPEEMEAAFTTLLNFAMRVER